jgi:hypothetical protein
VASVVYDAPKAAINTIFGVVKPQMGVDVGDVLELGSSAYEASKGYGATAYAASKGYGTAALDKASQMFMWKNKLGGGAIDFLEGPELEEFNQTIGIHIYKLHERLTTAFFNKYGQNTVLDTQTLELVVFMEKSYDLFLHSILPWVASKFSHSRTIQVEPGLRKALILRAFCNVKTKLKSKYIRAKYIRTKSKKNRPIRSRTLKY